MVFSSDDKKNHAQPISSWIKSIISRVDSVLYRRISAGILWKERRPEEDGPFVGHNSDYLKKAISQGGFPILDEHDPGKVVGTVIDFLEIKDNEGLLTLVGAFAIFEPKSHLTFADIGDWRTKNDTSSSTIVSTTSTPHVFLSVPSTHTSESIVQELAPPSKSIDLELRHNFLYSSDISFQIWEVAVPITLLLAPFAKQLGQDLAKEFYAWLRKVVKKAASNENSIVTLRTEHQDCNVLLLIRSGLSPKDTQNRNQGISEAVAEARRLVDHLRSHQMKPKRLTMEYEPTGGWSPTNVLLHNGRIVWDGVALEEAVTALDSSKTGLSLGLTAKIIEDE